MHLVIAEKPAVAQSIAAVLGAKKKENGYLIGAGYIVSWCVGHLVELAMPHLYDERYAKWQWDHLPILPEAWQYMVSDATRKQFNILRSLMNDARVDTIVCATDAGREGELIFRLVYHQCRCTKPIKRLWISSLEESAIRSGFLALRDGRDFDLLYQAALCRAQADWLVGINATRLYSLMYGTTLNVGRVMSPTLALIVSREASIMGFQAEPFYSMQISCGFLAHTERMADKAEAERIQQLCNLQTAVVQSIETKQKSEKPPRLYDLTSLQCDANRLFGYSAKQTLDYAQSLYEKKLLSYPRTDSRYLTSEMDQMVSQLAPAVAAVFPYTAGLNLPVNAAQVIDDSKVSDHHAIIPTQSMVHAGVLHQSSVKAVPELLNDIFYRFNMEHPEDFYGHSLSVSDIVALKVDGSVSVHYVDRYGFQELHGFLSDQPLKNAEMQLEDDYGIINNGKRESERPSVVEQLRKTPDRKLKPPSKEKCEPNIE